MIRHRNLVSTLGAVVVASLAAESSAQLIMGTADRDEPIHLVNLGTIRETNQYPVPVNIADSQPLVTGFAVTGMAADDANGRVYFLDFATSILYRMSYNNPGSPEFLGIVRQRNLNSDEMSLQSLAFDTRTGNLYGTYNIGGTPGEGIYRLHYENPPIFGGVPAIYADPELMFRDLPGGEGAWQVQNLDFDPVTEKIYGVNDDSDGRGLHAFDLGTDTAQFIVESPTHRRVETNFDGLATGGGMAYFTTDKPGFVYIYDLVNGGPFRDFLSPVQTDSGLFGGAAYAPGMIPEPTTLSLIAALGLGALRVRRGGVSSRR